MKKFYPEGILLNSEKNIAYLKDLDGIENAKAQNITLEAIAISCDSNQNLKINIDGFDAYMPKEEVALGIKEGKVRDIAIISRVGRPICFKVISIDKTVTPVKVVLSRRLAQLEVFQSYIKTLNSGDIIPAKITHLEPFGAFVDVGCGVVSLIGIENISVSRINHPKDRFKEGQDIFAIVLENQGDKINLSHKELLGTWQENAQKLTENETVTGIIRSIEQYGVFIELFPNLSGLAEYYDDVEIGDCVSVHIKSINEEKMKIKLNIIAKTPKIANYNLHYFYKEGNIKTFNYSPACCTTKNISRTFY